MFDFWNTCGEADGPPRKLIGMSFRLGIPWQVALQQSLPPLSQPEPLCNDEEWSVEQCSAHSTCLTDSVSQNSPQSTNCFLLTCLTRPASEATLPPGGANR
jgi:hypothetical protein